MKFVERQVIVGIELVIRCKVRYGAYSSGALVDSFAWWNILV